MAILKYKKGCNSGKICRKIIAIKLYLYIHEIHLHTKPSFDLTMCSQVETKYLAILGYKKGHNSGKNCRKIFIIELDQDIHQIHLHATPSFNLSFHSQFIIWKPIRDTRTMYKKGCNSGKFCRKMIAIKHDLDIHEIHLHTKPSFNRTICSQVIIWKPNIWQF